MYQLSSGIVLFLVPHVRYHIFARKFESNFNIHAKARIFLAVFNNLFLFSESSAVKIKALNMCLVKRLTVSFSISGKIFFLKLVKYIIVKKMEQNDKDKKK